jgi:MYXO-CTERM domain-containing protein
MLMLMPLAGKADAGIIDIKNNTATAGIGKTDLFLQNILGAIEGNDSYDTPFIDPIQTNALEIYTSIGNGFDSHPVDTLGWDFDLGVKGNVNNIDNYLRYKVTDTTDLVGKTLSMYDITNPSVKYDLLMDNAYHNITLPNLTHGAGQYGQWRLDVKPASEPSTGALALLGLGGIGALGMRRKYLGERNREMKTKVKLAE